MKTIYLNQDNHHFYGFHPAEDMTPEGVDRLVDFYAQGEQLAGLLFCVNVQRALFPSKVWERFWDGYDPEKGEDQPAASRKHGVANLWLLQQRGIDQFERWLARCRHHGIEGWLSMRMNDSHGLFECARKEPGLQALEQWPSQLWREHPELRRAPYRWERSWEGSFDYCKAEVREHHLNLVRELFERYDMFGLELDWMRWGMMFAPGHEGEGRTLLNDFVREVRKLANQAEARLGHPIKLAHRLPADPQSCMALGYDPICWAREGMADMVTLSSFCGAAYCDYSIDIWRAMLGENVKLIALAESTSYIMGQGVSSYEFLNASAASALQRKADGIYLFNECYRESDARDLLLGVLNNVGDLETLQKSNRRHLFSPPQVLAPGEPLRGSLPITLRHTYTDADFGRWSENISLRIASGPKPVSGRAVLCLGFSADTPCMNDVQVRVNTVPIALIEPVCWKGAGDDWALHVVSVPIGTPRSVASAYWYELPLDVLHDDTNVVEFVAPQADGMLVWAEIVVLPA